MASCCFLCIILQLCNWLESRTWYKMSTAQSIISDFFFRPFVSMNSVKPFQSTLFFSPNHQKVFYKDLKKIQVFFYWYNQGHSKSLAWPQHESSKTMFWFPVNSKLLPASDCACVKNVNNAMGLYLTFYNKLTLSKHQDYYYYYYYLYFCVVKSSYI